MTCVVGIETPEGVVMGADSVRMRSWATHGVVDQKVYRRGPFVIGSAGDVRPGQVVRYLMEVIEVPSAGGDMTDYMVSSFTTSLRKALAEAGSSTKENEQETMNVSLLVGVLGQLFIVSHNFAVMRSVRGYAAVGSGEDYAMGALHVLPHVEPVARVEMALEAAAEHSASVAPPFVVLEP